jgi:quinoprotein glucose dehydrogenase
MLKRLCVDTRHPPLSVVVSCTRIEGAVTDTLACVMWDQCALFVGKSMSDRVVCRVPNTAFSLLLFAALLGSCSSADFAKFQADTNALASPRQTTPWPSYAGAGSARFTDAALISSSNIDRLKPAWSFRTGDANSIFQNTPILANGLLIVCSPFNKVSALDPLTGAVVWNYDAEVGEGPYPNQANCRALAQWSSSGDTAKTQSTPKGGCTSRLFLGTNDARLIALDGQSGAVCSDFGDGGEINLVAGIGKLLWSQEYQVTSPPAVVGDVVVVGSAVSDNQRIDAPSGVVRAFDVRTGELVWAFDLAPPDFDYTTGLVSDAGYALGTPNVWAGFAVDQQRDMVFLPTGNPAPDYFRNEGPDMAYYGSSVIALQGSTGDLLWHFKTVERDFWDFDVPSIPSVVDLELDGEQVPALIQSTKMGFIFVLNRETGEPLIDVEQRQVPRYGPLKDQLSPTQPFPPEAFQVSRGYVAGQSPLGLCSRYEEESQIGDVYTPITEQWTIGLPSNMGATNWGGVAVDAQRGLIAVHANSLAFRTKLLDQAKAPPALIRTMNDTQLPLDERREAYFAFRDFFGIASDVEVGVQTGTAYSMARHPMFDPYLGIVPCAGFPLGEVLVIDLNQRKQMWRQPHGQYPGFLNGLFNVGLPQMGGPLLTSTGLFFLGSLFDSSLRAYDVDNGELLWKHALPAPGAATPMSYSVKDEQGRVRQFVVIAAGGDTRSPVGGSSDYVVAFAIEDEG